MQTTEQRRLSAVEARVTEVEEAHGDSIYRLERRVVGLEITLARMAAAMGVEPASGADIDAHLDGE